jgi:putative heme-binding domain-containing protein
MRLPGLVLLLLVALGPTLRIGLIFGGSVRFGEAGEIAFPRPAAVWPSGPLDLVIAFPRPVSSELAKSMIGRRIAYFESAHPGTKSPVSSQPLGALRIAGASLADENRTLILATDPHPWPAQYQLELGQSAEKRVTCAYDLSGVEASWFREDQDEQADPQWKGWLPNLDMEATRKLARESVQHQRCVKLLDGPGRLLLATLVNLPPGDVDLRIESSGILSEASLGDAQAAITQDADRSLQGRAEFTVHSTGEPMYLSFKVETRQGSGPMKILAEYRIGKQGLYVKIEREILFVPWAPITASSRSSPEIGVDPELGGGDPRRGEALFFSDQAKCSQCHAIGGRGGTSGPDLTLIGRKERSQIYRSIAAPSAEIAPEYMPYTVAARDGRVVVGVVRAEAGDSIRVTDTNAKTTSFLRSEIEQIRPSGTSIMPVGLAAGLGDSNLRDLIAYLAGRREENNRSVKQP